MRTRRLREDVIAALPASAFGNSEWIAMTAKTSVTHLAAAIASNQPHRVANAVRSMAHAPSVDEVGVLAQTICDALAAAPDARHDAAAAAPIANARRIIADVIAELQAAGAAAAPERSLVRETVNGYVRLIGLHDRELAERLDAVGTLAERLARFMKLPPDAVLEAELAGRLHDVGMLDAPRSHDERFEHHAIAGESFLAGIPSLARLAPLVRSHHERFDGRGYPDGLCGAEIPQASRIVRVAAAFVDLVTGSPHAAAMLPHRACHALEERAGAELDPLVVSAVFHLLHVRRRTHRSA